METMSDSQFSRPGAVDLSSLTQAAEAPVGGSGARSWVTEVTEATLDQVVQLSMRHPVVLELWSPRARGADQLSADLAQLTDAAAGRWLLARVNVDAEPRVAQALQVQAVPTVVAIIGGQVAPLFQGTQAREQIAAALDQVVQVSAASGIVGRAEAVAAQSFDQSGEQPIDPRFEQADAALQAGDYATALAEYDTLLAATPRDPEVIAGRAQVALLVRSQQPVAPGDPIEREFAAADAAVLAGDPRGAFDRLLGLVREHDGEVRERARQRLLELFAVVGNSDPTVLTARRELSTALF